MVFYDPFKISNKLSIWLQKTFFNLSNHFFRPTTILVLFLLKNVLWTKRIGTWHLLDWNVTVHMDIIVYLINNSPLSLNSAIRKDTGFLLKQVCISNNIWSRFVYFFMKYIIECFGAYQSILKHRFA